MQEAEYVTGMVFADTPLLRRVPAAYKDGVYEPSGHDRPNPLDLSDELLEGDIGTQSITGKTALLVFFGKGLENHTHFNEKALKNHNLSTETKMGSFHRNKDKVLALQKYQQTKKVSYLIKGISVSFFVRSTLCMKCIQ